MGTLFIVNTGNGATPPRSARELGLLAATCGHEPIEVVVGVIGTRSFAMAGEFLAGYSGGSQARLTYHTTPDVVCGALLEGLRSDREAPRTAAWSIGSLCSQQDIVRRLQYAGSSPESILAILSPGELPLVLDHLQTLRRDAPTVPLDPGNVTVVHIDGDTIWCEQPRLAAPAATPAA
ncbi:MAG: hypothetical protein PHI63_02180 [Patescibacteria group bacterium]|nr:hypothetical protein [Patescibacteria group bacterium]